MSGLSTYKRTIPAGKTETIGARGIAIIVRNVVGEVRVTARASQVGARGGQAYTNVMRKFEKWFLPNEFDSVEVENPSSDAVEVELLIGYGDFVREVTSRSSVSKFITALGALGTDYDYNGTRPGRGIVLFQQFAPENLQRGFATILAADLAGMTVHVVDADESTDGFGVWTKSLSTMTLTDDGGGDFSSSAETAVWPFKFIDEAGDTQSYAMGGFAVDGGTGYLSFTLTDATAADIYGSFERLRLVNNSGEVRHVLAESVFVDQVGSDALVSVEVSIADFVEAGAFAVEIFNAGYPYVKGLPVTVGVPLQVPATNPIWLRFETFADTIVTGGLFVGGMEGYYDA